MKPKKPTKVVMAKGMGTSRTELDRQLDPENTSVMLHTLQKVVVVVDWKLRLGRTLNQVGTVPASPPTRLRADIPG